MYERIGDPGRPHARSRRLTAAIAAVVALGAGGGSAVAAGAPRLSQADTTFLKQASQSNRFEIATSEVAVQLGKSTSKSASARALGTTAEMIANDHRKAQTMLGALEKKLSVQVSNRPDPLQQFLVSQLAAFAASTNSTVIGAGSKAGPNEGQNNGEGANGKLAPTPSTAATNTVSSVRAFYLRMQVATHQLAIARFTTAARTTSSGPVRAYACTSLPMLQRHLRLVEQALGTTSTGSSTSTATAGGTGALPSACSNG
jgi:predicted outer membrane protein